MPKHGPKNVAVGVGLMEFPFSGAAADIRVA
jgi:hypothetical protein